MNTVCLDIKNKMVAEGLGVAGSISDNVWGIHVGEEPDKGSTVITLRGTPGPKPTFVSDKTIPPMQYDNFQIRVRGRTYVEAEDKLRAIVQDVNEWGAWNAGGAHYSDVLQTSEILALEKTGTDRYISIVNYQAFRKRIP